MGAANVICHRRRRRRIKPPREIDIAVTPNYVDNAATASDLLVLAPCESAEPPAWVDPMLDEFAASLVASRSTGVPVLRLSTPLAS
jgi:hypothetical protein